MTKYQLSGWSRAAPGVRAAGQVHPQTLVLDPPQEAERPQPLREQAERSEGEEREPDGALAPGVGHELGQQRVDHALRVQVGQVEHVPDPVLHAVDHVAGHAIVAVHGGQDRELGGRCVVIEVVLPVEELRGALAGDLVAARHFVPQVGEALVEARGLLEGQPAQAAHAPLAGAQRDERVHGDPRDRRQHPGERGALHEEVHEQARAQDLRVARERADVLESHPLDDRLRMRVRAAVGAEELLLGEQLQRRPLQGQRRTEAAMAGVDGEVRADRRAHGLPAHPEHGRQQRGHAHQASGGALARENQVRRPERAAVVVLAEAPGARRVGQVAAAEVEDVLAVEARIAPRYEVARGRGGLGARERNGPFDRGIMRELGHRGLAVVLRQFFSPRSPRRRRSEQLNQATPRAVLVPRIRRGTRDCHPAQVQTP